MNNIHDHESHSKNLILKRAAFLVIQLLFGFILLFVSSGDFAYVGMWILSGLYLITYITFLIALPRKVMLVRSKKDDHQPLYEKILHILLLIFGYGTYIVAGIDYRYQWSQEIPLYMLLLAIFIFILGMGITLWAMIENPYFNKHISKDEKHTIIVTGPYAVIRHPGYLGMMTYLAVTPIILQSMYAMIPALATIFLMIIRTYLEDSYLSQNFEKYKTYQKEVKNKLFRTYKS